MSVTANEADARLAKEALYLAGPEGTTLYEVMEHVKRGRYPEGRLVELTSTVALRMATLEALAVLLDREEVHHRNGIWTLAEAERRGDVVCSSNVATLDAGRLRGEPGVVVRGDADGRGNARLRAPETDYGGSGASGAHGEPYSYGEAFESGDDPRGGARKRIAPVLMRLVTNVIRSAESMARIGVRAAQIKKEEGMSPRVVGLLRGAAEAALGAALLALASFLEVADLPAAWAVYVPILILALRTLEAEIMDERRGGRTPGGGRSR